MIKLILNLLYYASLLLVMFLFIGHLEIHTKPFHINIPDWRIGLGVVLIIIGTCFVISGSEYKGKINQINKESKL